MHALCSWDLNEHFPVVAQSPDCAPNCSPGAQQASLSSD